jgi:2-polyprenyl-6-methoxyphenol hydroxylase-like FAD-dependent oxidoreductase
VLIVGAGPTGLTLACELARSGVSFRLIEAAPGPQPGSRGKGIQPRTLEVFDDLGLVDRVIANGRMAMPMRSTAPDGQVTLGGAEPSGGRPGIPYPASLITPEWRTEEALRLRLAELGGAVEFGTALDRFEQSDESVSAVITRGGEAQTVTARWLVGCDGGHSIVRKQAGIAFEGETREELRMIVADVEVDRLDRDFWHLWRHGEGPVSLCPPALDHHLPVPGRHRAGTGPRAQPGKPAGDPRAADRPYRHPPPRPRVVDAVARQHPSRRPLSRGPRVPRTRAPTADAASHPSDRGAWLRPAAAP